jgi:hypothetical protein
VEERRRGALPPCVGRLSPPSTLLLRISVGRTRSKLPLSPSGGKGAPTVRCGERDSQQPTVVGHDGKGCVGAEYGPDTNQ